MLDQMTALHMTRRLIRALPDGMPGKYRLTNLALRPFRTIEKVHIPDRFGNAIWCPSLQEPIAAALFANGVYEPKTIAAILERLAPEGTYLDVGANIGAIALAVAASRPTAKVICVEADPNVAEVLRRNIAENRRSNVTAVECLAGARSEAAVNFYRAPVHNFGMGSIGPQFGAAPIVLRQRALDDVLDEIAVPAVDVLKLDIEGSELSALRGLSRRLQTGNTSVILEFSDWAEARIPGQSPGDAQAFLMSLGYRLFELATHRTRQMPIMKPLTSGGAMILAIAGR